MQHVQNFESLGGRKQTVAPLRVTVVRPSIWEQVKTKVEQVLAMETKAEVIFGAVTILLALGLFVGLARALAHYTIVPWP
jgi:hypothetical protein